MTMATHWASATEKYDQKRSSNVSYEKPWKTVQSNFWSDVRSKSKRGHYYLHYIIRIDLFYSLYTNHTALHQISIYPACKISGTGYFKIVQCTNQQHKLSSLTNYYYLECFTNKSELFFMYNIDLCFNQLIC